MKLQRSTIILMFGALLMGGAFYYYETLIIPAQSAKQAFAKKLFKFTEEDVKSLLVKTETKTLRFERASEISAPKDLWFMEVLELSEATVAETATTEETTESTTAETVPLEEPAITESSTTESNQNTDPVPDKSSEKTYANEAYVSFLLEQLVSDRSQQTLTANPEQIREYGLNPPIATIEITLKDRKTHQLILGKSEFSGNYIYARVDPPIPETANQQVMVVSKNFEYAVDRTLEDWKQPKEILEENPAETPGDTSEETPKKSEENLEETTDTQEQQESDNTDPTDRTTDPEASE